MARHTRLPAGRPAVPLVVGRARPVVLETSSAGVEMADVPALETAVAGTKPPATAPVVDERTGVPLEGVPFRRLASGRAVEGPQAVRVAPGRGTATETDAIVGRRDAVRLLRDGP